MPQSGPSGGGVGALLLIGFDHFAEAAASLGPLAARNVMVECA